MPVKMRLSLLLLCLALTAVSCSRQAPAPSAQTTPQVPPPPSQSAATGGQQGAAQATPGVARAVVSPEVTITYQMQGLPVRRNPSPLQCAISSDGRYLATADSVESYDMDTSATDFMQPSIILWDLASGQQLKKAATPCLTSGLFFVGDSLTVLRLRGKKPGSQPDSPENKRVVEFWDFTGEPSLVRSVEAFAAVPEYVFDPPIAPAYATWDFRNGGELNAHSPETPDHVFGRLKGGDVLLESRQSNFSPLKGTIVVLPDGTKKMLTGPKYQMGYTATLGGYRHLDGGFLPPTHSLVNMRSNVTRKYEDAWLGGVAASGAGLLAAQFLKGRPTSVDGQDVIHYPPSNEIELLNSSDLSTIRALTAEGFSTVQNPSFSPDGSLLVAFAATSPAEFSVRGKKLEGRAIVWSTDSGKIVDSWPMTIENSLSGAKAIHTIGPFFLNDANRVAVVRIRDDCELYPPQKGVGLTVMQWTIAR